MQELMKEVKFVCKCRGNTKIVNHKKAESIGAESRSQSRSSCSPHRELTTVDHRDYTCRPSLKNFEKIDLIKDNEAIDNV